MSSRVQRSLELRINFGDYEGVTIRASVERECDEGEEQKTLGKLDDLLANALDDQLSYARKFAVSESAFHEWEG